MRRPVPTPADRLDAFEAYAAAGHQAREGILLDANESAWGPVLPETEPGLHRYPDATYRRLREAAGSFVGVDPDRVAVGNGSDELLDLAVRGWADPGDSAAIAEPTYGMYRTVASLNGLSVTAAGPGPGFALDADAFLESAAGARLAILCSPNNPTANRLGERAVCEVLERFDGLVILDEAYVEFAADGDDPNEASLAPWTAE
ncbi:MAG: aminotransferase class I/II-fold pyridoxal phosphate-dependent enzyme, partial [Gemmatimonadota bacterium]|nr:aminotransferase class I/II-fold pyridoxal phosphate-dependent enzyme [Gemmatimonadota bacterium]